MSDCIYEKFYESGSDSFVVSDQEEDAETTHGKASKASMNSEKAAKTKKSDISFPKELGKWLLEAPKKDRGATSLDVRSWSPLDLARIIKWQGNKEVKLALYKFS